MEVVVPATNMDFDFNSARSSPTYMSAPSTPRRFGDCFYSAPTSPTRGLRRDFEGLSILGEESGSGNAAADEDDDFAFDFCEDLERASLSAEELFDGGKIRPLKPPPARESSVPSRSAIAQGKKIIRQVFSPREKTKYSEAAEPRRGRERASAALSSTSRRSARSHSPYRVSAYPWEEDDKPQNANQATQNPIKHSGSSSSKGSKRWKLRDLLLFRSASEGHATDKHPLKTAATSRRKNPVSAHKLHYNASKAASEDLKKKTFLPYKQGILGLASRFGSFTR